MECKIPMFVISTLNHGKLSLERGVIVMASDVVPHMSSHEANRVEHLVVLLPNGEYTTMCPSDLCPIGTSLYHDLDNRKYCILSESRPVLVGSTIELRQLQPNVQSPEVVEVARIDIAHLFPSTKQDNRATAILVQQRDAWRIVPGKKK